MPSQREFSQRFDEWSPQEFRLTPEEIEKTVDSVPDQVIEDIRAVQARVRLFAELQLGVAAALRGRDGARGVARRPVDAPSEIRKALAQLA